MKDLNYILGCIEGALDYPNETLFVYKDACGYKAVSNQGGRDILAHLPLTTKRDLANNLRSFLAGIDAAKRLK